MSLHSALDAGYVCYFKYLFLCALSFHLDAKHLFSLLLLRRDTFLVFVQVLSVKCLVFCKLHQCFQ